MSVLRSESLPSAEFIKGPSSEKRAVMEKECTSRRLILEVSPCGTVCSTCRHVIGDHSNIFMFCDHRYCSEECRDLAIQAASCRRYY